MRQILFDIKRGQGAKEAERWERPRVGRGQGTGEDEGLERVGEANALKRRGSDWLREIT